MPAIKPPKKPPRAKSSPSTNGTTTATGPVLTLTEAAEYLRVVESVVLELVTQQGLPGRLVGREWRFLKTAVDGWLSTPADHRQLLRHAGVAGDDPDLDQILANIYRERGRPMVEESR